MAASRRSRRRLQRRAPRTIDLLFRELLEPKRLLAADVAVQFSDQVLDTTNPITVSIEGKFEDTAVSGTVVKFETNAPLADNDFYVELTDNTPLTNSNFLSYVNSGAYDNSLFHRAVSNFLIQGGGFSAPTVPADQPGSDPVSIPTSGAVQNEPGNLNTRGTISMAKLGGQPDSATSQFFFNLENNSFLDTDNGGYTVFGEVLGSGMTVVDTMATANTYDATTYYSNTALSDLPLWNINQDNIMRPNDFVKIENADVVTESDLFTYQVSSTDTAKLTASFNSNGDLVLTPVGNAAGSVDVTVTATSSLDNSTASDTFSVTLEVDSFPFSVTSSEHGFELDDLKPTITGFGAPGASIEVFADLNRDGTAETSIGTTTVASDNSWSLTSDAWLPGGPVNVSATQDIGVPELSTADGVITVRTNRPGALVEVNADLLADGYINAAEAASNIVLRTPFDGSMISAGNSLWVFTDTGGNKTFVLQTVGSTAQANNYKDVGFSADLLREGPQAIDAWFTPTSSGGKAREVLSVTKDTIAPEATLGISDASIFPNETATVSITLSEDVSGLGIEDFLVAGGTLTNLSGTLPNLTATFTPDVGFSGTATISITSDTFTDVAGNPNSESSDVTLEVDSFPFSVTSSEHGFELDDLKPTITGFGAPGASIEVFADLNRDGTAETSIGTTTVASDNSWSLTSDAWLPGGPVNVSATQDIGVPELSTADGVITVRTNRPGALVEVNADLLADGYINAAEAASNIVLRTPFDGSMISAGNSLWVFTDTGGNKTFVLQTVGSTAQANNYKDVGFSADLLREGPQAIDAWFTPTSSGGKAREVLSVTKDTIAPEATLGISDASIFPNETATVSITLSEDVSGLGIEDFLVAGGTLTNLSGTLPNLTATFTPDVGFSGTATISITSDTFTDVAGNPNSESSDVTLEVDLVNDVPTLNVIGHISVDEDDSTLAIGFSGITAGGNDTQELKITASSGSAQLIPDPAVTYTSPNTVGSLTFTPVADQHGIATITVTVEDSGIDGDLNTTEDNLTFSRTFDITVTPVNDVPTLDALSEVEILEDAAEQIVSLTGITAGGGENQQLSITAVSDNIGLIPDPTVDFDGQSSVGSLRFTPVADQFGTATITVTVEDGGLDNDLGTPDDNGSILRTVVVKADAVNDEPTLDAFSEVTINEDDPEQAVSLIGITAGGGETQKLKVTATSNNSGLISDPTVMYTSANPTGTLTFTPVPDQNGTATITVTVEDGGLDNDLSTKDSWQSTRLGAADNNEDISLVDVDNDGDNDLVLGSYATAQIEIRLNNGDGTFAASDFYSSLRVEQDGLATADFNSDGFVDIVVAGGFQTGKINLHINNGDGTFASAIEHSFTTTGGRHTSIKADDIDGDGVPEVAVNDNYRNGLFILDYDSPTQIFSEIQKISTVSNPGNMELVDVDSDGDIDLIGGEHPSRVTIYKNDGTGHFSESSAFTTYGETRDVVVGDIDNDGDPDLIVAFVVADKLLTVLENDGTGVFSVGQQFTLEDDTRYNAISLSDLDQDGWVDIVFVQGESNLLTVYENTSGVFDSWTDIPVGLLPTAVTTGDIDGDTDLDIVVGHGVTSRFNVGSNDIYIIRNTPDAPNATFSRTFDVVSLY